MDQEGNYVLNENANVIDAASHVANPTHGKYYIVPSNSKTPIGGDGYNVYYINDDNQYGSSTMVGYIDVQNRGKGLTSSI